ncbi:MAG: helix-turn-helix transcriptional regulator [Chitinophagaceae bacterium]|jgi:transcriptional regulator with XRE-family HTH domain
MEKKDFNVVFGNSLKSEREKRSISQSELARLCFKDRQYIHSLEKGDITPTLYTVYIICKELGVDVSALFPTE